MPANKPSARAMIAAALLVFSAILAWRVSSPVADLLHAYQVHVTLTGQRSRPHVTPSPAVRYVVIPPKVCQP